MWGGSDGDEKAVNFLMVLNIWMDQKRIPFKVKRIHNTVKVATAQQLSQFFVLFLFVYLNSIDQSMSPLFWQMTREHINIIITKSVLLFLMSYSYYILKSNESFTLLITSNKSQSCVVSFKIIKQLIIVFTYLSMYRLVINSRFSMVQLHLEVAESLEIGWVTSGGRWLSGRFWGFQGFDHWSESR